MTSASSPPDMTNARFNAMDNHALLRSGGGRLFPNLHVNRRHLAKHYRYPTYIPRSLIVHVDWPNVTLLSLQ
jgi:hypothetical protein